MTHHVWIDSKQNVYPFAPIRVTFSVAGTNFDVVAKARAPFLRSIVLRIQYVLVYTRY